MGPVRLRQWKCQVHQHFRQYPEWLVRYKHYLARVIDASLQARADGTALEAFCEVHGLPDPRTPSRWVAAFCARLQGIGLQAERALHALRPYQPRGSPLEVRWQYAYVWRLLGRLQNACQAVGRPLSRAHFIFSL